MKFKLIEDRKSIARVIVIAIWMLGIISMIFSIIFQIWILGVFFFFSTVVLIVGGFVIKTYNIIGEIEIRQEFIKVIISEVEYVFKINEIMDLYLTSNGAKGDSYGGRALFSAKNGAGNIVSFNYNKQFYNYEFLVEQPNLFKVMRPIFRFWHINGVNFKLYNNLTKDITSKVIS